MTEIAPQFLESISTCKSKQDILKNISDRHYDNELRTAFEIYLSLVDTNEIYSLVTDIENKLVDVFLEDTNIRSSLIHTLLYHTPLDLPKNKNVRGEFVKDGEVIPINNVLENLVLKGILSKDIYKEREIAAPDIQRNFLDSLEGISRSEKIELIENFDIKYLNYDIVNLLIGDNEYRDLIEKKYSNSKKSICMPIIEFLYKLLHMPFPSGIDSIQVLDSYICFNARAYGTTYPFIYTTFSKDIICQRSVYVDGSKCEVLHTIDIKINDGKFVSSIGYKKKRTFLPDTRDDDTFVYDIEIGVWKNGVSS